MRRTTVTIDGRRFLLSVAIDSEALERAVVEAARSGGDVVRFAVAGEREIGVLISPGFPVFFEYEEIPDEELHESDEIAFRYDDIEYLA